MYPIWLNLLLIVHEHPMGGGGYSNMKLVYMCRAGFKNGGLRQRPHTRSKISPFLKTVHIIMDNL